jgi:hypothetical protein
VVDLGDVEVVVDLLVRPHLVQEEAPHSVGTVPPHVERNALLLLVLVDQRVLPHQLVLSMRKLAFFTIPAAALLDPVLAHLGFVEGDGILFNEDVLLGLEDELYLRVCHGWELVVHLVAIRIQRHVLGELGLEDWGRRETAA